jgi:hypothetical protein
VAPYVDCLEGFSMSIKVRAALIAFHIAGATQAICTTSTPRSRVISRPRPGGCRVGRRLPRSGPSSGLPESSRPGWARSRRLWMTGS